MSRLLEHPKGLICPHCEKPLSEHDEAACRRKMSRRYFLFGALAAPLFLGAGRDWTFQLSTDAGATWQDLARFADWPAIAGGRAAYVDTAGMNPGTLVRVVKGTRIYHPFRPLVPSSRRLQQVVLIDSDHGLVLCDGSLRVVQG